jgi:hypothetical protein
MFIFTAHFLLHILFCLPHILCIFTAQKKIVSTVSAQLPSCIGGLITDTLQHNQLVLRYSPPDCLPEVDISRISDPLLLDYLCQGRAVFPYSCNTDDTFLVECLTPLRKVVSLPAGVPYSQAVCCR